LDSLSDWLRMIYGLLMGTSTPLIQPEERGLVKLEKIKIDNNMWVFKGGSGNGCVLRSGSELLLVNTNRGSAAEEIYHFLRSEFPGCQVSKIINTQCGANFSGGNDFFPDCKDITVGEYSRSFLVNEMGDRKLPTDVVTVRKQISFGDEFLHLIPLGGGPLLVFLVSRNILLGADPRFADKIKIFISEMNPVGIY